MYSKRSAPSTKAKGSQKLHCIPWGIVFVCSPGTLLSAVTRSPSTGKPSCTHSIDTHMFRVKFALMFFFPNIHCVWCTYVTSIAVDQVPVIKILRYKNTEAFRLPAIVHAQYTEVFRLPDFNFYNNDRNAGSKWSGWVWEITGWDSFKTPSDNKNLQNIPQISSNK